VRSARQRRAARTTRLDAQIHGKDGRVRILDPGPAGKVRPRVESLAKTFVRRHPMAIVI
jgi:hypothetical protein